MNKIDYLSLDGNCLQVFVAVLEEQSVTKAAERLGVTQSAVSHTLDKLRAVLQDPLFVRSGRSIAPTQRALDLLEPVREVLDKMKALTDSRVFDPKVGQMEFTVAANDFMRSLIFPPIVKTLYKKSIDTRFAFLPSRVPGPSILRQGICDFLITPFPPEGDDIFQVRLFSDSLKCFYDSNVRSAPASKRELLDASHIDVVFEDQGSVLNTILTGMDLTTVPKPRISVPNFDALTEFITGTDMVTVQLGRMAEINLKDLSCSALPFKSRQLSIYLAWHRRNHHDPAYVWLRELIKGSC